MSQIDLFAQAEQLYKEVEAKIGIATKAKVLQLLARAQASTDERTRHRLVGQAMGVIRKAI